MKSSSVMRGHWTFKSCVAYSRSAADTTLVPVIVTALDVLALGPAVSLIGRAGTWRDSNNLYSGRYLCLSLHELLGMRCA